QTPAPLTQAMPAPARQPATAAEGQAIAPIPDAHAPAGAPSMTPAPASSADSVGAANSSAPAANPVAAHQELAAQATAPAQPLAPPSQVAPVPETAAFAAAQRQFGIGLLRILASH